MDLKKIVKGEKKKRISRRVEMEKNLVGQIGFRGNETLQLELSERPPLERRGTDGKKKFGKGREGLKRRSVRKSYRGRRQAGLSRSSLGLGKKKDSLGKEANEGP